MTLPNTMYICLKELTNHMNLFLFNLSDNLKVAQYNLLSFTNNSIVICKIIVGDGFPVPWADVGIRPYEKRRKIYESNRNC